MSGPSSSHALAPEETVRPGPRAFEYHLVRVPVGVVVLGSDRCIRSLNPEAGRLLAGREGRAVLGLDILDLHPEPARAKVAWLIDQARLSPEGQAALVVTTPMGSLVAKVTRLEDAGAGPGCAPGYCMMFHTLGDAGMGPADEGQGSALLKLPVTRGKGDVTTLVDVNQVVCLSAQGHYAEARTLTFAAFCPRSLADLERRLPGADFLRVHRRHLVNVRHILAAERVDGRLHLRLADEARTRIPVSRDKVAEVRRLLAV
ncbi:LytTR family DNA-binding domain-containing protein [Pararhodospirillum oryzae]|uniref:CO-responsive transcriptional regulator RcoM n=1 Tax=Pararhodospirillum oryzae TaxID=478448 RepID=A0A512H9G8_9PROT|nr:LytTR family DNA-binding domain-containing protein [Pararhodospirillum oryzae]GEO82068.1 CO-responsive transcriptional regulator RcoM [Pararhodospirillum oryzae]